MILLSSCSLKDKFISLFKDDGAGYIFKISLDNDPVNLDPQIAQDDSSIMIARNLFTGLLTNDQNGALVCAVAKDYTISPDGLTYTFYLDSRYKWRSVGEYKSDVTADDFVFGFRRLFSTETNSPYAEEYFCIKGAKEAYSGNGSLDDIGIKAIDQYTLIFTLEYPNAEFLYSLAKLPASPCNEQFFDNCKGKYGLEADCVASNGAFYVRYWQHDPYGAENYVRLRRNESYSEISRVYPSGVNFLIEKNKAVKLSDFTGGATDIYLTNEAGELLEGEYNQHRIYNTSCGIVINSGNEILANDDVRLALSQCIDRSAFSTVLPEYLIQSCGLVPRGAFVGGTAYRQNTDEPVIEYNPRLAEFKWSFILSNNQKEALNGTNILVPDWYTDHEYLSCVTDMWYDVLGLSIGIEVVNGSEYINRLSAGEYDMCLAVISSETACAYDYISPFLAGGYGLEPSELLNISGKLGKYKTLSELMKDISVAEKLLISDFDFIPLWYTPRFVFYSADCDGIWYDAFSGAVVFDKAKHF